MRTRRIYKYLNRHRKNLQYLHCNRMKYHSVLVTNDESLKRDNELYIAAFYVTNITVVGINAIPYTVLRYH